MPLGSKLGKDPDFARLAKQFQGGFVSLSSDARAILNKFHDFESASILSIMPRIKSDTKTSDASKYQNQNSVVSFFGRQKNQLAAETVEKSII
ncbi:MAG: hypothetical protein ACJAQ6_001869 [Arenicella sp.]|jgi:hypothetical protein